MSGIYIHIPFCKQACHYCDFHFSTSQEFQPSLVAALNRELSLQKDYLKGELLSTIYFGGGTPSLLEPGEIDSILQSIVSNFQISDHPEITLEANPDDLTQKKLAELKHAGINRLSIGIQSFDETILKFLNRAHTAEEAVRCFEDARAAGFDNVSVDLIYAIPNQDDALWEKNISKALALEPEHLSSYSLTLEEKTVFGKWQKTGRLQAVDEEIAAQQFERLMDMTAAAGYEHYEISNFSKPGFHSQHNSNYWKQQTYLGIGPSAHSYDQTSRQFNVSSNAIYVKSIQQDKIPFEREVLSRENKINEYIFTTLRTSWGTHLDKLKEDFGVELYETNEGYLNLLQEKKLVTIQNRILTLTRSGKLVADEIASNLFMNPGKNH